MFAFAAASFLGPYSYAGSSTKKKIEITPATRDVLHALYYVRTREKIEKVGTEQFPTKNGASLYGVLRVKVPVVRSGSIYELKGGPKIVESSGNKDLDRAALQIVRKAAPFNPFPKPHFDNTPEEIWEMVFRFNFTTEVDPHNTAVDADAPSPR